MLQRAQHSISRISCALDVHDDRSSSGPMEQWLELRTAMMLARLGTVSGAAAALGVHRATVTRHVEVLEAAFGARLFQRHARGYTPTEAGRAIFEVAARADEMFSELQSRAQGVANGLSGALTVTSFAGVAPFILPAISAFTRAHPQISLRLKTDAALARLEYGEAHVAIRAGAEPKEPDYVVRLFRRIRFGLYAHERYLATHGAPTGERDLAGHRFIGDPTATRTPYAAWLAAHVADDAYALKVADPGAAAAAVAEGLGLGFVAETVAGGLIEVLPPRDQWSAPLWTVTHVDLHRIAKVQAFLRYLRDADSS